MASLLTAACVSGVVAPETPATAEPGSSDGGAAASNGPVPEVVRLGYFPNVTHASAIVGVAKGFFQDALGPGTRLETATFDAGPAAIEALFAGGVDATYVGPNPAVNAFAQSDGEALRIVSGATSGGAFLVVREGIDHPQDLAGTTIASPQLGNTQDVALRKWLRDQGYETTLEGGGDVTVQPQENSQSLETFLSGDIDGAWVPEPWATRLIQEAGGHVLVDERDLWPNGQYVTTHLVVSTEFLRRYPGTVRALIEGQVAVNDFLASDPDEARRLTNEGIGEITGKPIPDEVIDAAWKNLEFTNDPVASSLHASARAGIELGLLDPVDLDGIYDLALLNEVLAARGEKEVAGP
jgi:NitT/TauT family transport system substrate-binding protein